MSEATVTVEFSPDTVLELGENAPVTIPAPRRSRRIRRKSTDLYRTSLQRHLPVITDSEQAEGLQTGDGDNSTATPSSEEPCTSISDSFVTPSTSSESELDQGMILSDSPLPDISLATDTTDISMCDTTLSESLLDNSMSELSMSELSDSESPGSRRGRPKRKAAEDATERQELSLIRTPKRGVKRKREPSLEEIYTNKLWREQMPKEKTWETIFENPHLGRQGKEVLMSAKKLKRLVNFDDVVMYEKSRLKKRRAKAMKMGWRPMTQKKIVKVENLVRSKIGELDEALAELSETTTDTKVLTPEISSQAHSNGQKVKKSDNKSKIKSNKKSIDKRRKSTQNVTKSCNVLTSVSEDRDEMPSQKASAKDVSPVDIVKKPSSKPRRKRTSGKRRKSTQTLTKSEKIKRDELEAVAEVSSQPTSQATSVNHKHQTDTNRSIEGIKTVVSKGRKNVSNTSVMASENLQISAQPAESETSSHASEPSQLRGATETRMHVPDTPGKLDPMPETDDEFFTPLKFPEEQGQGDHTSLISVGSDDIEPLARPLSEGEDDEDFQTPMKAPEEDGDHSVHDQTVLFFPDATPSVDKTLEARDIDSSMRPTDPVTDNVD